MIRRVGIDATPLRIGDEDAQRRSIADRTETCLAAPQFVMGGLALDQVTQGAWQPVAVDMPFHQVITGAALDRLARGLLIAGQAEHDDQGLWCHREDLLEGPDALAVR